MSSLSSLCTKRACEHTARWRPAAAKRGGLRAEPPQQTPWSWTFTLQHGETSFLLFQPPICGGSLWQPEQKNAMGLPNTAWICHDSALQMKQLTGPWAPVFAPCSEEMRRPPLPPVPTLRDSGLPSPRYLPRANLPERARTPHLNSQWFCRRHRLSYLPWSVTLAVGDTFHLRERGFSLSPPP